MIQRECEKRLGAFDTLGNRFLWCVPSAGAKRNSNPPLPQPVAAQPASPQPAAPKIDLTVFVTHWFSVKHTKRVLCRKFPHANLSDFDVQINGQWLDPEGYLWDYIAELDAAQNRISFIPRPDVSQLPLRIVHSRGVFDIRANPSDTVGTLVERLSVYLTACQFSSFAPLLRNLTSCRFAWPLRV